MCAFQRNVFVFVEKIVISKQLLKPINLPSI